MAIPEKAILDAVYLASLGRYSPDVAAQIKYKQANYGELETARCISPKWCF